MDGPACAKGMVVVCAPHSSCWIGCCCLHPLMASLKSPHLPFLLFGDVCLHAVDRPAAAPPPVPHTHTPAPHTPHHTLTVFFRKKSRKPPPAAWMPPSPTDPTPAATPATVVAAPLAPVAARVAPDVTRVTPDLAKRAANAPSTAAPLAALELALLLLVLRWDSCRGSGSWVGPGGWWGGPASTGEPMSSDKALVPARKGTRETGRGVSSQWQQAGQCRGRASPEELARPFRSSNKARRC
jgi:hypothetical protein